MSARGVLMTGDLYYREWDDVLSAWGGMEGPYEVDKFAVKPDADTIELVGRGKTTDGQVLESVSRGKPTTFSVTMLEVTAKTIHQALFGTKQTTQIAASTVTDRPVTAQLDKWVQVTAVSGAKLQNWQAAGLVVTNSGGTTTYVLGTDYVFNYSLGMIKALSGGAIAQGASLLVDGSTAAYTSDFIKGSTKTQARLNLILDGRNLADGNDGVVEVFEAVLKPNAEHDFMGNAFAKIEMTGTMKTPAGKDSPYTVDMRTK